MTDDGNDIITSQAQGRLRSLIERVERLEQDKAAIAEDLKEVYSEAKGEGFDVKIMRKVVSLRKKDKVKLDEEQTLIDLYLEAIGDWRPPLLPTPASRKPKPPKVTVTAVSIDEAINSVVSERPSIETALADTASKALEDGNVSGAVNAQVFAETIKRAKAWIAANGKRFRDEDFEAALNLTRSLAALLLDALVLDGFISKPTAKGWRAFTGEATTT